MVLYPLCDRFQHFLVLAALPDQHLSFIVYASAANSSCFCNRFMAAYPDRWDYTLAAIPSPLTDDQEAAQEAKRAEKAAKRKEVLKERKKEKRAQDAAAKAAEEAKKKEEESAALAAAAASAVRYGKGKGLKAVPLSKAEKEEVRIAESVALYLYISLCIFTLLSCLLPAVGLDCCVSLDPRELQSASGVLRGNAISPATFLPFKRGAVED